MANQRRTTDGVGLQWAVRGGAWESAHPERMQYESGTEVYSGLVHGAADGTGCVSTGVGAILGTGPHLRCLKHGI